VGETDCGWVPYLKEQADDRFQRLGRGPTTVDRLPSDEIGAHFSFTYITDHYGIRNRHDIGVERILWSSDYPHIGSDWPNSWRTIAADFSGVPPVERDLILAGNARRLYRFGDRAQATGRARPVEVGVGSPG
jgi:predicted TIM-barrel fold metal-dependent hydrolase